MDKENWIVAASVIIVIILAVAVAFLVTGSGPTASHPSPSSASKAQLGSLANSSVLSVGEINESNLTSPDAIPDNLTP